MKSKHVQTLKDEETAVRVEEELRGMGLRVKRNGREITQYLLPRRKEKKKHEKREHTSKREREHGYARGVEDD